MSLTNSIGLHKALEGLRTQPILGKTFLLAVSGGGDSMALAVAARDIGLNAHAAVVDHGLRAESRAEALQAASTLQRLELPASVLTVQRDNLSQRSQNWAREQRLSLLADEARRVGARTILFAHTAEDQAETIAFRLARGSGVLGLAGMAELSPFPIWPGGAGLLAARPLLGQRRTQLRAFLTGRNISWIEDPSNSNQRFARVRIRRRLFGEGSDPDWCARVGRIGASAARILEEVQAKARTVADQLDWASPNHAVMPAKALNLDTPTAYLIGSLSAAVGGRPRQPSLDTAARCVERVRAGETTTLAGTVFTVRRGTVHATPMPPRRGSGSCNEPIQASIRVASFLQDLETWVGDPQQNWATQPGRP